MDSKSSSAGLDLLEDPARDRMLPTQLLWAGFGVQRPKAVIDFGTRTGHFAVRFAEFLAPGGTIWVCDTNPTTVQWMQRHLSSARREAIKPLLVQEGSVGLPAGSVELVYLIERYHELKDPRATLAEMMRLLARGGVLAVVDWKREPMRLGPPLRHRLEAATIRTEMTQAGFSKVEQPAALEYHYLLVGRKG